MEGGCVLLSFTRTFTHFKLLSSPPSSCRISWAVLVSSQTDTSQTANLVGGRSGPGDGVAPGWEGWSNH